MIDDADMNSLLSFVDEMRNQGFEPNVVTYNTLLSICPRLMDFRERDFSDEELKAELMNILWRMKKDGVKPDAITRNNLVQLATLQSNDRDIDGDDISGMRDSRDKKTDAIARKIDFALSLFTGAAQIFPREQITPDVNQFNVLLALCKRTGFRQARQVYSRMKEAEIRPNATTFIELLNALRHSSEEQVSEGNTNAPKLLTIKCRLPCVRMLLIRL